MGYLDSVITPLGMTETNSATTNVYSPTACIAGRLFFSVQAVSLVIHLLLYLLAHLFARNLFAEV